MKKIKFISLLLTATVLLNSCATILSGTKQQVFITSEPPKAEFYIKHKYYGTTPAQVKIPRKTGEITFKKEGCNDYVHKCETKLNPAYFINFIFLLSAPIPLCIDLLTGACVKQEENVKVILEKRNKTEKE